MLTATTQRPPCHPNRLIKIDIAEVLSQHDLRVQLELWGKKASARIGPVVASVSRYSELIQQNQLFGRKSQISEISANLSSFLGVFGGGVRWKIKRTLEPAESRRDG